MRRHGFGEAEHRYFTAPLPPAIETLRRALYDAVVGVANVWAAALGHPPYPPTLSRFLARCHAAGQRKPTPLLLRYGPGDSTTD